MEEIESQRRLRGARRAYQIVGGIVGVFPRPDVVVHCPILEYP